MKKPLIYLMFSVYAAVMCLFLLSSCIESADSNTSAADTGGAEKTQKTETAESSSETNKTASETSDKNYLEMEFKEEIPIVSTSANINMWETPAWEKHIRNIDKGEEFIWSGISKKADTGKGTYNFYLVRAKDDKQGWIPGHSINDSGETGYPLLLEQTKLGAITEQCIVYKTPSISDPTDTYLEKMSIVAVSQKNPRSGWWKIRWVKNTDKIREWWVKAKNLTFAEIDLGAIKLYNLAEKTENKQTKQSLLNTLLSDYKNSVFISEIQKAHQKMISESIMPKKESEKENNSQSIESESNKQKKE